MSRPSILWGMDPLFHVPMQLLIFQINAMKRAPEHEGVYCHHSRPVAVVETVGVIQEARWRKNNFIYQYDGTGVLQCIMWIPDQHLLVYNLKDVPGFEFFKVGQVVRVRGTPGEYRDEKQLTVPPGGIVPCKDPNEETVFRLRVMHLERTVYTQESVLPERVMKEAESALGPFATKEILLETLREWVKAREGTTFSYFDIEGDEGNTAVVKKVLKAKAYHPVHEAAQMMKLMTDCLHTLRTEGLIDIQDDDTLVFRAVVRTQQHHHRDRRRNQRSSVYEEEKKQELLHKVINLDDDDDDL